MDRDNYGCLLSLRSTRSQQEMAHKMLFVLKTPRLESGRVGSEQNGGPGQRPNKGRLLFFKTSWSNRTACPTLTARGVTQPPAAPPPKFLTGEGGALNLHPTLQRKANTLLWAASQKTCMWRDFVGPLRTSPEEEVGK